MSSLTESKLARTDEALREVMKPCRKPAGDPGGHSEYLATSLCFRHVSSGKLLSIEKLKITMKKNPLIALTIISLLGSYALPVQADDKRDRDGRDEISIDERFEFLDKDKDDELTLKEFSNARFLDAEEKKQIAKVFAKYDKNSDETLRPREFETGVETHHPRHFLHHHHRHVVKGKPGAPDAKGKPSKGKDAKIKATDKAKSGGKSGKAGK